MNRVLWGVAVLVGGLALGGCASSGGTQSSARAEFDNDNIDQEKIVSVNKWASDRGHGVTWVNLPRKARKLDQ